MGETKYLEEGRGGGGGGGCEGETEGSDWRGEDVKAGGERTKRLRAWVGQRGILQHEGKERNTALRGGDEGVEIMKRTLMKGSTRSGEKEGGKGERKTRASITYERKIIAATFNEIK